MLRGTQDAPPSAPRAPRACALLPTGRGRELRQDARLQQLRPARVTSHNASCVGSSMPRPRPPAAAQGMAKASAEAGKPLGMSREQEKGHREDRRCQDPGEDCGEDEEQG